MGKYCEKCGMYYNKHGLTGIIHKKSCNSKEVVNNLPQVALITKESKYNTKKDLVRIISKSYGNKE